MGSEGLGELQGPKQTIRRLGRWSGGTLAGRRYRITKSQMSNGRSQKLEAEELGGQDYVSFNVYRLATGEALLKPCEMSAEKVIAFVKDVDVD